MEHGTRAVKSSAISHIGYDADTHVLAVHYKSVGMIPPRKIRFADVPEHVVAALHRSESIGRFVKEHVIPHYKPAKEKNHVRKQ